MPIFWTLTRLPRLPIFTLFQAPFRVYHSRPSDMEVALFSRWSIKKKLVLCVALIALIVCALSISGMVSVYAYRDVVRTISFRVSELPLAHDVTQRIDHLVAAFQQLPTKHSPGEHAGYTPVSGRDNSTANLAESGLMKSEQALCFLEVEEALKRYREQLEKVEPGTGISDNREELVAVARIEQSIQKIDRLNSDDDWVFNQVDEGPLRDELKTLQTLAAELPNYLQRKMSDLKGSVRGKYHTLIGLNWTASILSGILLVGLIKFFYDGVVRPLQTVMHGSRRVAGGDFEHRVELDTHDEMAELASALNAMTSRFKEIRDDLDRQVRERTKEVVRGEQLASVGFLAAGVAHEINNPLQAIAMCAESLESRVHDIIAEDDARPDGEHNGEITVLRKYLRRIQDEAFRCKGITEKLLSYSRLGDAEKQNTDLTTVVTDVIELIHAIRIYRGKRIEFTPSGPLIAPVVPHEIKQVVLNLITNALDSLDPDGLVQLELTRVGRQAQLLVRDNGCGMSEEVKKHLFEPFFTRRRDGQGTGLGLSITYRIVQDHGGDITVTSDGPGSGSTFRITLPLYSHEERHEKLQAA